MALILGAPAAQAATLAWGPATPVASAGTINAMTCVSVSECVFVAADGAADVFNPSNPSTPTPLTIDSYSLQSVACTSVSVCVAVDAAGSEVTFDPTNALSPVTRTVPIDGLSLSSVSCWSSTVCVAIDAHDEVTFDPTKSDPSVSQTLPIDAGQNLSSVACLPGTVTPTCIAVDDYGQEITFDPTSPTAPTPILIDFSGSLSAIACPSSSLCVTVDHGGHVISIDPGTPAIPWPLSGAVVDLTDTSALQSVACVSASNCVVGYSDGNWSEGNPTLPSSWTAPALIQSDVTGIDGIIHGIGCASATECVAVEQSGDAYVAVPVVVTGAVSDGSGTPGVVASDTAAISGAGTTPSGTVTYSLYSNADCGASESGAGVVSSYGNNTETLTNGTVPSSSPTGALTIGEYSFQELYSGYGSYPAASDCTSFSIRSALNVTTTVTNAGNKISVGAGGSSSYVYDAASFGDTTPDVTPTGTVTYSLFRTHDCSGASLGTDQLALDGSNAGAHDSSIFYLAAPGYYSFQASYSGDTNYAPTTGACEPFSQGIPAATVSVEPYDVTGSRPINNGGGGDATLGDSVYGAATITGDGFGTPTGTVTYTLYSGAGCTSAAEPIDTPLPAPDSSNATSTIETIAGGSVPSSNASLETWQSLPAGQWSIEAVYSGDSIYPTTSQCFAQQPNGNYEYFTVDTLPTTVASTLYESSGTSWASAAPATEVSGVSVYADNTAVTGASTAHALTGTVTYTLSYCPPTQGCDWVSVPVGQSDVDSVDVALAVNGTTATAPGSNSGGEDWGPLKAGSYSLNAAYSGEASIYSSEGKSLSFTVVPATPSVTSQVDGGGTYRPWDPADGNLTALDTAAVAGVSQSSTVAALEPTGTVSYALYSEPDYPGTASDCASPGTASYSDLFALMSWNSTKQEAVPRQSIQFPSIDSSSTLGSGYYLMVAAYSGDSNYVPQTDCRMFEVGSSPHVLSGTLHDPTNTAGDYAWTDTEVSSAAAYDTSAVVQHSGPAPTGTVTYTLYADDGACTRADADSAYTVDTVSLGTQSATTGTLTAGTYSFKALYSGDANYPADSVCQKLVVLAGTNTSGVVDDHATSQPWGGTEAVGAQAYGSSTVSVNDTISATLSGTVTYSLYDNGTCTGTAASSDPVTVQDDGSVPSSSASAALAAGTYSMLVAYSGDANYAASSSHCEPSFSVLQAPSLTTSAVYDSGTTRPWAGTEQAGAGVYDTASVTGNTGVTPTGTVVYTIYDDANCDTSGAVVAADTVTLDGSVPDSEPFSPLLPGVRSYLAAYSGNSNYAASSDCEEFTVLAASDVISNDVYDGDAIAFDASVDVTGSEAYDVATFESGFGAPTGSVTFTFYADNDCQTPSGSADPESLRGNDETGSTAQSRDFGPLAAGSYSFGVTYAGDATHDPSPAACVAFLVGQATPTPSTALFDSSNRPWSASDVTGASVYGAATVPGAGGFAPTGSFRYDYYDGSDCGVSFLSSTKTLSAGVVPNSDTTAALPAGAYSYDASYLAAGDPNYQSANVSCTPFAVGLATPTVSATVLNSSKTPWTTPEAPPASAYGAATVTGIDGFTPSGNVTYTVYRSGNCTAPSVATDTEELSGGSVPDSTLFSGLTTGTYDLQASYLGDTNYQPGTSGCEQFQVLYETTTNDSSVRDGAGGAWSSSVDLTGSKVDDTAIVSQVAGTSTPTGPVTFSLYSDASCTRQIGNDDVVSLTGNSAESTEFGPLAAGIYYLQASYGGDGANASSTGGCQSFVVGKAQTTTSTSVLDSSGGVWGASDVTGATAHATATVSGAIVGYTPTGTVTYNYYAGGACSGVPSSTDTESLSGGIVANSASTTPLAFGSDSMHAIYSGDANYASSTSACEQMNVGKGTPSSSATVDDGTLASAWTGSESTGASAYDTATVSGSGDITPTGTETYTFYSNSDCTESDSSSVKTLNGTVPNSSTTPTLAPGSYSYQAVYSGDSNYDSLTVACQPFTVAKATPSVSSVVHDSNGGVWSGSEIGGSSAYDAATVDGISGFTPSGRATYSQYANGTCNDPAASTDQVTLGGAGSVSNSSATGALTPGSYSFEVSYSGDPDYLSTTSSCESFGVARIATSTFSTVYDEATASPWSGTETTGAPAYDIAVVSAATGTPTGTVTISLYDNDTCSGSAASTDTVALAQKSAASVALSAGSYSYHASYGGDGVFAASQGVCEPFTVGKASSSTASTVEDGATTAAWAGSEVTGASAYDTAVVFGVDGVTPTGSLTFGFYDNATCANAPFSTDTEIVGTPSSTTAALAAGSYSFEVSYAGDSNYNASTGVCEPFTVAVSPSTTSSAVKDQSTSNAWDDSELTGASSYGTAAVGAVEGFVPAGTVTYSLYAGSGCAGAASTDDTQTLSAGSVPRSSAFGPLAGGSYSLTATYSGDANYQSAASSCDAFTVGAASSTTASAAMDQATGNPWAGSETTGAAAYATAAVGGKVDSFTPSASVTYGLYDNGACTGNAASSDQVTVQDDGTVPSSSASAALAAGTYSYRASYSGDDSYRASASSCQPFTLASTSSSTTVVVNDVATDSVWSDGEVTGASASALATVPGVPGVSPTGTVTYSLFASGDCSGDPTAAPQVTLSGGVAPATAPTAPLAAGSYSFRAHYSGDGSYQSSSSPCEPISIGAGPSTITSVVHDGSTRAAWGGDELTGATAYDAAVFSTPSGIVATDAVTYDLFADGDCSGTPEATDVVTIRDGIAHDSSVTGALSPGDYSYEVSYSGDADYLPSTSACAEFTVTAPSTNGTATAPPAITGSAAVDATLSCGNGSWSGNPIAFTYQWSRDGVAIPGATRSTHTITLADLGHGLGCAVTAVYTGGATATSSSVPSSGSTGATGTTGVLVPVTTTAQCPKPSGRLTATKLGKISLGLTRTQTLRLMPWLSSGGRNGFDTLCLFGNAAIRVAYASKTITGLLPESQRRKLAGMSVIALTSSNFYALKGIRPGTRVKALVKQLRLSKVPSRRQLAAIAKRLRLAGPFNVGGSFWLLAPSKHGTGVIRIQKGVAKEIGVANAAVTNGIRAQLHFLGALAKLPKSPTGLVAAP
ncbi:MAG: hypothetical protein ACLP0J_11600 [Solirubrobacteraceae bacterium]